MYITYQSYIFQTYTLNTLDIHTKYIRISKGKVIMAFFRKEKLLSIFFSKIIGKQISGDKALICIFSESYISIIIFFIPLSFTLSSFF